MLGLAILHLAVFFLRTQHDEASMHFSGYIEALEKVHDGAGCQTLSAEHIIS